MKNSPGVFVYGSCVSRDPFELNSSLRLVDYFARTSLGSAFRQPPHEWNPEETIGSVISRFQRRMVEADLKKTLAREILDADFDILVLDFIDERMSTIEFRGSTITESAELKSAGFKIDPSQSFEPWTEMGMQRRRDGIARLISICDPAQIVVNRVFWATHDSSGSPLSYSRWIARNNTFLAEMYAIMSSVPGVRFIDYPDGMLAADTGHQWGVQAYHYTKEASLHFLRELEKLAAA